MDGILEEIEFLAKNARHVECAVGLRGDVSCAVSSRPAWQRDVRPVLICDTHLRPDSAV